MEIIVNSTLGSESIDTDNMSPKKSKLLNFLKPSLSVPLFNINYSPYGEPEKNYRIYLLLILGGVIFLAIVGIMKIVRGL